MTFKRRFLTLILCLISAFTAASAQIIEGFDTEEIISQIEIFISEDETMEDFDFERLEDNLRSIMLSPIDLNKASRDELEQLPFLSDLDVENILFYIYVYGPMESVYELQLIEGLNPLKIRFLLPFIQIANTPQDEDWKSAFRHSRHEISSRVSTQFEEKEGYTTGVYPGLPVGGNIKYRFQAGGRLYAGLTMEHDAGEPFAGDGGKGFDLYRVSVEARLYKQTKIVVGDFKAAFGQGLLLGDNAYGDKIDRMSRNTAYGNGIKRYNGTDESNFFRGIGVTSRIRNWSLSAFYSFRHHDADTSAGSFSTIRTGGLHRTSGERLTRKTLPMHTAAVHGSYSGRHFAVGLTAYGSYHVVPRILPATPYYLFMFNGHAQGGVSADYRLHFNRFRLFGETAVNQSGAVATTNTIAVNPLSSLSIYLNHRYFSRRFDLYFSRAFASGSRVNNEHGLTFGFNLNFARNWQLNAYADIFRHDWVTYYVESPSVGSDIRFKINYTPSGVVNLELSGRYRNDMEMMNMDNSPLTRQTQTSAASLRFAARYSIGRARFQSGVEGKMNRTETAKPDFGAIILQDILYDIIPQRLSVSARIALFDADNWENRFYWYERNIPGSGYTTALSGEGCRWYLMISGKPVKNLTLSLRIAQTYYSDGRKTIGSGHDQTAGAHTTTLQAYLIWKL